MRGNNSNSIIFPQVNTAQENVLLVKMAEEALLVNSSDHWAGKYDYWMGGKKLENGSWAWQSGQPWDYSNWCPGCADRERFDYLQLAKHSWAGGFDTFYWVPITFTVGDNGVICEMTQTCIGNHIKLTKC